MSEFNAENLKEKIERTKKNNSIDGVYERFLNDIGLYLQAKFPMEPLDAIGEASVHLTNRAVVMNNDALYVRDKEWRNHIKKLEQHYQKERYYYENRIRGLERKVSELQDESIKETKRELERLSKECSKLYKEAYECLR